MIVRTGSPVVSRAIGTPLVYRAQFMTCTTSSAVHDIISNLDGAVNRGHKQRDLIIMDFAKAFDKVPHRRLLHKGPLTVVMGITVYRCL